MKTDTLIMIAAALGIGFLVKKKRDAASTAAVATTASALTAAKTQAALINDTGGGIVPDDQSQDVESYYPSSHYITSYGDGAWRSSLSRYGGRRGRR